MEFHIALSGASPDLASFRAAVAELDPAAVVDIDPFGQHLRVAASLSARELHDAARVSGWPLAENQIAPQPSVCCGGCGG